MATVAEASTSLVERDDLDDFDDLDDLELTDDELTELALAADPNVEIADDAVPFNANGSFGDLLPDWYMPAPAARSVGRRKSAVGAVIIFSLLAVNAVGLCVTNGFLEIA